MILHCAPKLNTLCACISPMRLSNWLLYWMAWHTVWSHSLCWNLQMINHYNGYESLMCISFMLISTLLTWKTGRLQSTDTRNLGVWHWIIKYYREIWFFTSDKKNQENHHTKYYLPSEHCHNYGSIECNPLKTPRPGITALLHSTAFHLGHCERQQTFF